MMAVNRAHQSISRPSTAPALVAILALSVLGSQAGAQAPNPSSVSNPFYGSITLRPATEDTLKLSLDDAISLGLKSNLGLKEAEAGEKQFQGEKNIALQQFLPTITLTGDTGAHQVSLAAFGFGPKALSEFAKLFPGGIPAGFSAVPRYELTEGQIHYSQTIFSGPVIAGYKAAGAAQRSAYFAKMSARGEVVQQVATAYLHCIAASSEVDNAKALVAQDQLQFDNAHAAHQAGTVANLDELRARVQLQTQQQYLIAAQNALEKDLILLKREIGIDPGQKIALTDPAPYSELASETPEEVRAIAYKNRQDYQRLQNEAVEYKAVHNAYRAQRLPTLSFEGFYGVDQVNGVGSHGNFVAFGTLKLPLFREAGLRGDTDVAKAQQSAVDDQLADLKNHIDEQVRAALLDLAADTKLIQVARSNVDLAARALSDETDRVSAGVDDNLPLVTAQASLASAQNNLVESLFRYNLAKLALARAAGVLETQYRDYLGR
jgi:outer membrane protein TolC